MKPVPLSEWRLGYSTARSIAEALWGRGGTSSEKCNRKGAFYFLCSGHGGYVIDSNALTQQERKQVNDLLADEYVYLFVQDREGVPTVIGVRHPYSTRPVGVRYPVRWGEPRIVEHPIVIAEEDCDWAVVELFTGVRSEWATKKDEENIALAIQRRQDTVNALKHYREEIAQ